MPKRTAYLFDDLYLEHELEPNHPESPLRLKMVNATLLQSGLIHNLIPLRPLSDEKYITKQCLSIHTPNHVAGVRSCGATGIAAYRAVGAVLAAIDNIYSGIVDNAFCAVRPPGHHVHNDVNRDGYCQGEGFCFLNNVAIGARYAQQVYGLHNILIIDWDFHHGNGTEEVFYADKTVFYFSTHRLNAYPGTGHHERRGIGAGLGYNCNVPLPAPEEPFGKVVDEDLIAAFKNHLFPNLAAVDFVPDAIFISAGFDGRENDPIGNFSITDHGFYEITKLVTAYADSTCGGKIVSVLEGGYDPDGLATAVSMHLKALIG